MESTSFDYTLDRIERLEQEVGRLQEDLRQSRDPGAVDPQSAGSLRSTIDAIVRLFPPARVDRAPPEPRATSTRWSPRSR